MNQCPGSYDISATMTKNAYAAEDIIASRHFLGAYSSVVNDMLKLALHSAARPHSALKQALSHLAADRCTRYRANNQ